jgi:hypothetical protein
MEVKARIGEKPRIKVFLEKTADSTDSYKELIIAVHGNNPSKKRANSN